MVTKVMEGFMKLNKEYLYPVLLSVLVFSIVTVDIKADYHGDITTASLDTMQEDLELKDIIKPKETTEDSWAIKEMQLSKESKAARVVNDGEKESKDESNESKEEKLSILGIYGPGAGKVELPELQCRAITKNNFVDTIGPIAQQVSSKYNILPSVMIAQAILESNYGKSLLSQEANNIFGVKLVRGYASYEIETKEFDENGNAYFVKAAFSKYDSVNESINFYGYMMSNSSRYKDIVGVRDPLTAITIIKNGGYATDPEYVNKVMSVINRHDLTRFDTFTSQNIAKNTKNLQARDIVKVTKDVAVVVKEEPLVEEVIQETGDNSENITKELQIIEDGSILNNKVETEVMDSKDNSYSETLVVSNS